MKSCLSHNDYFEVFSDAANALKAVSRNKNASISRIALWNAFFPDSPIPLKTSLRHRLTSSLHQFVSGGKTDKFCFELSVLFIDLPANFYELTSVFPVQLTIAMRCAFKVVQEFLQKPDELSIKNCLDAILKKINEDDFDDISNIFRRILTNLPCLDDYVMELSSKLDEKTFDLFLESLPPHSRIRYALQYNRPLPKVTIDYDTLQMPIEFLQAIAEIDGRGETFKSAITDDVNSLIGIRKK